VNSDLARGETTDEDDLRQLRDAVRGILGTAPVDATPGVDLEWRRSWTPLAELGLTALCAPERCGGFGFEVAAAVASARELGAALHASPYAGLVTSAHVLGGAGDGQGAEVLAGIIAGDRVCAFGLLDPSRGVARLVDGAPDADAFVLIEPSSGQFVLVTDPATWRVDPPAHAFDVTRACGDVVVAAGVGRALTGPPSAGLLYRLLLSADALGGVERVLERTVAYARNRIAFGRPIGAFQAVQHRLVDHTIAVRGMALAVTEAAARLAAGAHDAERHVAIAELAVTTGAVHVLHDLLQLTGAIGFTWEYGLHLYERRAHHDAHLAANPRAAVRSLAIVEGWPGAR